MRVLVIGGTGYLGGHVSLDLLRDRQDVAVVSSRASLAGSTSMATTTFQARAGLTLVQADLKVNGQLTGNVEKKLGLDWPQIIILAAPTGLPLIYGSEELILKAMEETLALGKVCPHLDFILNLSSSLVLGDTGGSTPPGEDYFEEQPNTLYGVMALRAERRLRRSSLRWVALRVSQAYGSTFPFLSSPFERFILNPIREGKMILPGTGRNRVDLVHVADVCAVVRTIVNMEKEPYGYEFNVGTGGANLTQAALFDHLAGRLRVAAPRRIPLGAALAYAAISERVAKIRKRRPGLTTDWVRFLAMDRVLAPRRTKDWLDYTPLCPRALAGIDTAYRSEFPYTITW